MATAEKLRQHAEFLRAIGASATTSVAAVFVALQSTLLVRVMLVVVMVLWGLIAVRVRGAFARARGEVGGAQLQQFSALVAEKFAVETLIVRIESGHLGLATLEGHARIRRITIDTVIAEDDDLCLATLSHEYAHLRLRHHRSSIRRVLLTMSPLALAVLPFPSMLLGVPVLLVCLVFEALALRKMRADEYAADIEALRVVGPSYLPGVHRLLGDNTEQHGVWSSHPADGLRRKHLDRELRRMEIRGVTGY